MTAEIAKLPVAIVAAHEARRRSLISDDGVTKKGRMKFLPTVEFLQVTEITFVVITVLIVLFPFLFEETLGCF